MTFSVTNLGIQELLADINYDRDNMPDLVADHLYDHARRAEALADRYAPKLTGYMASTIYSKVNASEWGAELELGATAHYTRYVHDGTARMGPRPFLARALADVSKPNGKLMRGLSKLGRLSK